MKGFSCSSFPINQLCNPNATRLKFLQNNSNQTILSNCKFGLRKKINTNVINCQKILDTNVCEIKQNNVINNSKQLRVIEDVVTASPHKVGRIKKFATTNNKVVEYFMTRTKITTTSWQNKDQPLLSLSTSQVKPILNCELDCFAISITKQQLKLNKKTDCNQLFAKQNDVLKIDISHVQKISKPLTNKIQDFHSS